MAFYLVVKRENLVAPMLSGSRLAPVSAEPLTRGRAWRLAVCVAGAFIAMALAWRPPA